MKQLYKGNMMRVHIKRIILVALAVFMLTVANFHTVLAASSANLNPLSGDELNSLKGSFPYVDRSKGCGGDTTDVGGDGSDISSDASKIEIVKVILGIAKTMGIDQKGAIVAIMVAMDESGLKIYANSKVPLSLNANNKQATGHDGYSLGVFQQQITTDWSTYGSGQAAVSNQKAVDQLMDPAYNAEAFFGGANGKPSALSHGLLNVSGWENKDPWMAAYSVQRSLVTDGSNYKPFYAPAKAYVDKYFADAPAIALPVPIEDAAAAGSTAGSAASADCNQAGVSSLGVGTGKFTDNTAIKFDGVEQMLAYAKEMATLGSLFKKYCPPSRYCYGRCEYDVGVVWRYVHGGYASAAVHWAAAKSNGQGHPGDRNVPVGALLYWDTGNPYGHATVYLGNNLVFSNDINDAKTGHHGGVYIVSADELETKGWHAKYLGWAEPKFPSGKVDKL